MLKISHIDVGTKRLEIGWYGPPPGENLTLVFLHEGLGCVDMWRDFPTRLASATGCGAMVYSRLGYGRSDACDLPRPVRFMHEEGLNILPKLLDRARIEECIIIGHSDGGSIGLIYAGGTPAPPLRGLITEAAHVFCEEITIASIQKARDRYVQGDLRKKLEKYHGSNTGCAFWGWNDAWLHPDFRHWNLEEYLPSIQVPILAIQGEEDPYGSPLQLETILKHSEGKTKPLMLSSCGHSPHIDCSEATFQAMKDFILSTRQRSGKFS
jgi:pimeloyl-ACP methyl ester carboxylesterase